MHAHDRVEDREQNQEQSRADVADEDDAGKAGNKQDDLHEVLVLVQESAPPRWFGSLFHLVPTILLQPCFGLALAQSYRRVHAEPLGDLSGFFLIPGSLGHALLLSELAMAVAVAPVPHSRQEGIVP